MSESNRRKSEQLGMPHGTAQGRLRKQIIFHLMQKCGMDNCHQCGQQIVDIESMSIEHKIPWMNTDNPVELFFDIGNIAFSHTHCNYKQSTGNQHTMKQPCPSYGAYQRGCRCEDCKKEKRKMTRESNRRIRMEARVGPL